MAPTYDLTAPWNKDVQGDQVLDLINLDVPVFRLEAGAGTGKTFGLKRRVLRLLHPDGLHEKPHEVLVCAFNRVIARDLRAEIAGMLKTVQEDTGVVLDMPVVMTVHSLCHMLLKTHYRMLLDHEIDVMLYDVLTAQPTLNDTYASQPIARDALHEHDAGKKSHSALMNAVRGWLDNHGAHLVGDIPRHVAYQLSAGDMQDRYRHILIDEFQDLTEIEARVLTNLRSIGAQIVAVGDRKQSIYSFRGNAMGGLGQLSSLVSEPIHDGTMDECRRCPEPIVSISNALMEPEGGPLTATSTATGQLHRLWWKSPKAEADGLAAEIARVFKAEPAADHLVMVTRREWGYRLREALAKLDPEIPVRTLFSGDVLQYWGAREAFIFLSIVADPDDKVAVRDWLSYRQHVAGKEFHAAPRNAPAYLALQVPPGGLSLSHALELAELPLSAFKGVGKTHLRRRLVRLKQCVEDMPTRITDAATVESTLDVQRWVDYTGPLAEGAKRDIGRLLREVTRIMAEGNGQSLKEVVRTLRIRIATREAIGEEDAPASNSIRIGTLYGAKGVTAHYTYVMGLCDEALPGITPKRATGVSAEDYRNEQRRLLYVSITRARRALVLSRPRWIRQKEANDLRLRLPDEDKALHTLHDTTLFKDLPIGMLPTAVDGVTWSGIQIN